MIHGGKTKNNGLCQSARLNTWILHGIIPCRSHD
ncbi:hypothetical protein ACN42_g10344, partial [Penicillium freii]